jgi:hypothetical protein
MGVQLITNWAQIIALPVALVAIIVSIVLHYYTRQHRALSCEFETPLFPVILRPGEGLLGEIEILYAGQPISNLYITRVTTRNTGHAAIRSSDVVEPLTFEFGPDVRLLREPLFTLLEPANLKVRADVGELGQPPTARTVAFHFQLLNQGDSFTIEFVCDGAVRLPQVSARIEGVRQIQMMTPEVLRYRSLLNRHLGTSVFALVIAVLASAVAWGLSLLRKAQGDVWSSWLFQFAGTWFILVVLELLLVAFNAYRWRRAAGCATTAFPGQSIDAP